MTHPTTVTRPSAPTARPSSPAPAVGTGGGPAAVRASRPACPDGLGAAYIRQLRTHLATDHGQAVADLDDWQLEAVHDLAHFDHGVGPRPDHHHHHPTHGRPGAITACRDAHADAA